MRGDDYVQHDVMSVSETPRRPIASLHLKASASSSNRHGGCLVCMLLPRFRLKFYFCKPRSREQKLRYIIVFSSDNVFPEFSVGPSQIPEHSNDLVRYNNWFPLCCAACVCVPCVQPALDTCLRPVALFQVLRRYLPPSSTIVYRMLHSWVSQVCCISLWV